MKPQAFLAAVLLVGTFVPAVSAQPAGTRAAAVAVAAPASAPAAPGTAPTTPPQVTVAPASGANLNISPKRVTFDRSHRSGSIFIFNQGSGPGTFDISLVDRVMMPDGQILPLADALAKPETKMIADRVRSAKNVLQVAPRRVTLDPGQGQTIRLRMIGAADEPGAAELRSHLTISTLPPREAGTTAESAAAAATPQGELRFQINALLGLSIPAIVRLNELDVRAGIENARLSYEQQAPSLGAPAVRTAILTLELVRQGANSLFGNVEIRTLGDLKPLPLGMARGVGVYPEIERRTIRIALTRVPSPGEHLEVTFTDDDTSPGKLLAKLTL